jgi:hypothetical protein
LAIGQNHTYDGKKVFWKGRKPGLFVNLGQFPCTWILIHIPNTYPDPGQPNQYGSMHKTEKNARKPEDFFRYKKWLQDGAEE